MAMEDENCKLPKNYELIIKRLKSLQKRLKDDPELLQKYDKVIKDQLEKGVIEAVDKQKEQSDKQHYITHHTIIRPENNTVKTKKSNPSLNECLHKGPVVLKDICGLLIRFRTKKIGSIVADIKKAFLQIGLRPKEKDVTRFLWLKDINLPVTPISSLTALQEYLLV